MGGNRDQCCFGRMHVGVSRGQLSMEAKSYFVRSLLFLNHERNITGKPIDIYATTVTKVTL